MSIAWITFQKQQFPTVESHSEASPQHALLVALLFTTSLVFEAFSGRSCHILFVHKHCFRKDTRLGPFVPELFFFFSRLKLMLWNPTKLRTLHGMNVCSFTISDFILFSLDSLSFREKKKHLKLQLILFFRNYINFCSTKYTHLDIAINLDI